MRTLLLHAATALLLSACTADAVPTVDTGASSGGDAAAGGADPSATPPAPDETSPDANPSPTPAPEAATATVADVEIELSHEVSKDLARAVVVDCPDDIDPAGSFTCTFATDVHGTRPVWVEPEGDGTVYRVGLDVPRLSQALASEVTSQVGQPVNIACPGEVLADVGTEFTCTFTQQDGAQRTVAGTVADDAGNVAFAIQ